MLKIFVRPVMGGFEPPPTPPLLNTPLPISQLSSIMQNWLQANCPGFMKRISGPNSSDFKPTDDHVLAAMLEKYHKPSTQSLR